MAPENAPHIDTPDVSLDNTTPDAVITPVMPEVQNDSSEQTPKRERRYPVREKRPSVRIKDFVY